MQSTLRRPDCDPPDLGDACRLTLTMVNSQEGCRSDYRYVCEEDRRPDGDSAVKGNFHEVACY